MKIALSRRRALSSGVIAALAVALVGVGVADAGQRPHPDRHRHRDHTPTPTPTQVTASTTTSASAPGTTTPTTATTTTSVPATTTTATATSTTSVPAQPSGVVFADHVAQFNVLCSSDHYAPDDPIVFPGKPGASHMHTFYGNTSTDAFSTVTSLSATSPSSCGRGMGTSDLSAYWVPSLKKNNADGTSSVVKTDQTNTVYYRRAGGGMGPAVHPFPVGLRMIAGNAMATSDQSLSIVQWDCGGGGLESPHMYGCPGGPSAPIHASLVFPSCWDGVHLDSADHKSHMAYAAANGACPADHPVSLPEVTFEVDFPGIAGGSDYFLASGGIYSMHGDFVADWDNQVQNALVASCLNVPRDCSDMNRDGTTLFRPNYDPNPVRIDLTQFPKTSPYDGQTLQGPVAGPTPAMSMPMP
ncbi:MAG TPA: DUF1996 domain-containing protein [Kineosporiaceae bacterium]|nr:DUF1996 domain-containing protein [Kineosporiaceae bacterium]